MIPAEAVEAARDAMQQFALNLDRSDEHTWAKYAQLALEAAAPHMRRTIATAAERATLQPGTICMDRAGNAWKRGTGSWVSTGGDTGPLYDEDDLELTVLHDGKP